MKRIDELIKKEIKLEKKRDNLQEELGKAEKELAAVHKLRIEAEKIMSRVEAEQKKLDDLLKDQIPQRGRKKTSSDPEQPEQNEAIDSLPEAMAEESYEERE